MRGVFVKWNAVNYLAIIGLLLLIILPIVSCDDTTTTLPASTTTPTLEEECASRNGSCDACVQNTKCLYCFDSVINTCRPYPVGQIIPHHDFCDLGSARWGVCWVNYKVLLICMGVLAGIIVLLFTCCCVYCCCCRNAGPSTPSLTKAERREERDREERKARGQERRTDRNKRLDEIRRKYGLVRDEQPYERFENA